MHCTFDMYTSPEHAHANVTEFHTEQICQESMWCNQQLRLKLRRSALHVFFPAWLHFVLETLSVQRAELIESSSACAGYWAVDAKAETAINGSWRKGPGQALFDALEKVTMSVWLVCSAPMAGLLTCVASKACNS